MQLIKEKIVLDCTYSNAPHKSILTSGWSGSYIMDTQKETILKWFLAGSYFQSRIIVHPSWIIAVLIK